MNERALQRQFTGDPIAELDANTAAGSYQFQGLSNTDTKREWVPGVRSRDVPREHVVWLMTNNAQTWTPAAERYFASYNSALLQRRKGKRLDTYGEAIK